MTVIERSDGRDGKPRGDGGPGPAAGGDPVAVHLRRRGWAVVALAVLLAAAVLRAACYLTVLQAPADGGWADGGWMAATGSAAPDDGRAVDPWGPHPWRSRRLPRLADPVPPAPVRATLVSQGPGPDPGPDQPAR